MHVPVLITTLPSIYPVFYISFLNKNNRCVPVEAGSKAKARVFLFAESPTSWVIFGSMRDFMGMEITRGDNFPRKIRRKMTWISWSRIYIHLWLAGYFTWNFQLLKSSKFSHKLFIFDKINKSTKMLTDTRQIYFILFFPFHWYRWI